MLSHGRLSPLMKIRSTKHTNTTFCNLLMEISDFKDSLSARQKSNLTTK